MKNILVIMFVSFLVTAAHAQSVETMKICGEYSVVYQMEKDIKQASKHGGSVSPDSKAQFNDLKKAFDRKKKQYEKETGEKFSVKTCKENDLL